MSLPHYESHCQKPNDINQLVVTSVFSGNSSLLLPSCAHAHARARSAHDHREPGQNSLIHYSANNRSIPRGYLLVGLREVRP